MVGVQHSGATDSELRYRRLFEAARDGILIVDPVTCKIIDVNPFLEELLDYDRDEILGKELYEVGLLGDEDASKNAFRELQVHGYIRYDDLPLKTKTGRSVAVEFVSNLYREGDHDVIQCNIRDITERKRLENALRDAGVQLAEHADKLESLVKKRTDALILITAKLEKSNDHLETFVQTVAHDLRAPLRTLSGFSGMLLERYATVLDEDGRRFTRFIDAASQRMGQMLNGLMEFSHLGQHEVSLCPMSLGSAVEYVLDGLLVEIRETGAVIERVGPWPVVLAHAATLQQVLLNLITNALKYVDGKAPVVRLRTEKMSVWTTRIWVEDNGIGIDPQFHESVFTIFNRLHTSAFPGTGVGLAIVRKGAERMGGCAGVESTPGDGARFWIELKTAPGN
jgi:PAS domain S-box-containing protein